MKAILEIPGDISYQGCIGNRQNILLEEPPYLEFQNVSTCVPLPRVSNVQCQTVTKLHSCFTQTPPSVVCRRGYLSITDKSITGKWKFEHNQPLHKCNNSQNLTESAQSPQMILKSYPDQRGQVVQSYVQPLQTQQYYTGNVQTSGYRQQLPSLTITQLNYQPGGYQQFGQTQPSISTTNVIYGTSNNENRCGKNEIPYRYFSQSVTSQYGLEHPVGKERTLQKNSACSNNGIVETVADPKPEVNSEMHCNFEYTIQPEQLVKSLCDDREHDTTFAKLNNVHMRSLSCGSPNTWSGGSFLQRKQFDDNEFTKFLTQGCLQAEAIATRNQNRPCFKNIKHLCTRTRTDIMKPKTTVANIHSQGIPWATKDFIFAFIRLINCWHILRGYLENDEGSLGKIDAALTPEIREKYYRWQNESKDLLRLLNSLFINLDKGVTLQNAEIFSKFNNLIINNTSASYTPPSLIEAVNSNSALFKSAPSESQPDRTDYSKNNSPPNLTDKITEETNKDESFTKGDKRVPANIPGILRVKEIFNDSKETNKYDEDSEHKEYIKPGTYDPPESAVNKEMSNSDSDLVPDSWETLACSPSMSDLEVNNNVSESHISPDNLWENAIKTTGSFIKRMMNNENESIWTMDDTNETNDDKQTANTEDIKTCMTAHCLENNNVKENAEELADSKKTIRIKKQQIALKGSNRKNIITTKIFKKRIDERDVNHNKGPRYKNGNKSQTKYLCKRHEVNKTESSICETPKRTFGLTPITIDKFEKIMNELWLLPFSKYVTFEVNAEYVPDYYKHINKPMFLCNIMNGLKLNKYKHVNQVVHDLRTIVWNSELYIQKRPDWWFEKCLHEFSSELELQLTDKFANINFSSVTGDPSQMPTCELDSSSET